MGFWSSIKNIAKKVWRGVKAVVRIVVRVVVGLVAAAINVFDLLLGFLNWPPKKLRLHVFILRDENGAPVASEADLMPAIASAQQIYKDRFNVRVVPYSKGFVETMPHAAPTKALEPYCDAGAWADLFREAGDYYAKNLAGWVGGIPISLSYPITAYVVRDVQGKRGCAIGPLTDYLTIDPDGFKHDDTTLAHETGHCCYLPHLQSKINLMWPDADRGTSVRWWQKNLVRSCRHVTYW